MKTERGEDRIHLGLQVTSNKLSFHCHCTKYLKEICIICWSLFTWNKNDIDTYNKEK